MNGAYRLLLTTLSLVLISVVSCSDDAKEPELSSCTDACEYRSECIPSLKLPALTELPQNRFVDFFDQVEFLLSESNALQRCVEIDFEKTSAGVLRGEVRDVDGKPVAGAFVSVSGHDELGHTYTRADGAFDFVVPGGRFYTVRVRKKGYLTIDRPVEARKRDFSWADSIVMTRLSTQVQTVDLSKPGQVVKGEEMTDQDGTRRLKAIFDAPNKATIELPDGKRKELDTIHMRITEYTVGDNIAELMPAPLPENVAYTYAVELSIDEAMDIGAERVLFEKPFPVYVDNFLNFEAGTMVPVGYYDREKNQWIPSEDGIVINILSIDNGDVRIDSTGNGQPDDSYQLERLGISTLELKKLSEQYESGDSLWRVPVNHFSPHDFNWGFSGPTVTPGPRRDDIDNLENPCTQSGSIIECENRVLGELIPLTGTPFGLAYRSERVGGASPVTIRLSDPGDNLSDIDKIHVQIEIAGKRIHQTITDLENTRHFEFVWDGEDAYGRKLQGMQTAYIRVDYEMKTRYATPPPRQDGSFGGLANSEPVGDVTNRSNRIVSVDFTAQVGTFDAQSFYALGGWSLTSQKAYDKAQQIVYPALEPARLGADYHGYLSDHIFLSDDRRTSMLEFEAHDSSPRGMATSAGGTVFMAVQAPDQKGVQIVQFTEAGNWKHVAGRLLTQDDSADADACSKDGNCADDSPLMEAILVGQQNLSRLAANADASVLFYTRGHSCVRKIDLNNNAVSTIYGKCGELSYDWERTTDPLDAEFVPMHIADLAAGPDGSAFINLGNRIVKVVNTGKITSVVGGGENAPEDGALASDSSLYSRSVTIDKSGRLYFDTNTRSYNQSVFSLDDNNRLVKVFDVVDDARSITGLEAGPSGVLYIWKQFGIYKYSGTQIELLLGGTTPYEIREPDELERRSEYRYLPAKTAIGEVYQFAIGHNDTVFVTLVKPNTMSAKIHTLIDAFPGVDADESIIASKSGGTLDIFDSNGRIIRELHAMNGQVLQTFEYDDDGRLIAVRDQYGKTTQIERDSDGTPTAVIGPYGQKSLLNINENGLLESISDPAGNQWAMSYHHDKALLASLKKPNGALHTFQFDNAGKLTADYGAEGESSTLHRMSSRSVSLTSAEGRKNTYSIENNRFSSIRTVTNPAGNISISHKLSGERHKLVLPDGTITESQMAPDPRFSFQAPYIEKSTTTLPSGLEKTTSLTKSVNLTDAEDFMTVESMIMTSKINDQVIEQVYNAAQRTWVLTSPEGRVQTVYLDELQRPTRVEVPGLAPTSFRYDDKGRLLRVERGDATTSLRTWRYQYTESGSAAGTLAAVVAPDGQTTKYDYDNALMLTRIEPTSNQSDAIDFTWADGADLTALRPPSGTKHRFEYDLAHRTTAYIPPSVNATSTDTRYTYSPDGLPKKIQSADDQTIDFSWSPTSYQLRGITTGRKSHAYTYDATSGNVTEAVVSGTDGTSKSTYNYDGPFITQIGIEGHLTASIEQTYDNFFRLKNRSINGAHTIDFQYSADGLLTKSGNMSMTYNAQNALLETAKLNSHETRWEYNEFGEPENYLVKNGSKTFFETSYQRDLLGRITELSEELDGQTLHKQFKYDEIGRLVEVLQKSPSETSFVSIESYQYNPNGNRIAVQNSLDALQSTDISIDAQDRLTSYGNLKFQYNANGQLTTRTDTAAGKTDDFDYDIAGSLEHVKLSDGRTIDYKIDEQGRRAGRILADATGNPLQETYWLYKDGLNPIAELDASHAVITRFVYATRPHVPDYMTRGSKTWQIITDHLGSVRLVVDTSTGTIDQKLNYDTFGNVLEDTNPGFQPFGYAGGLYDHETNLVRFGARDYDPRPGRWTAKDPIGFAGGDTNLYGYVWQDPVNFVDISGESPLAAVLIGAGLGIAAHIGSWAVASIAIRITDSMSPAHDPTETQNLINDILSTTYDPSNPYKSHKEASKDIMRTREVSYRNNGNWDESEVCTSHYFTGRREASRGPHHAAAIYIGNSLYPGMKMANPYLERLIAKDSKPASPPSSYPQDWGFKGIRDGFNDWRSNL